MADEQPVRIAIDDVVEAASAGVLRALEARKVSPSTFTRENGFSVRINIEAGNFPIGDPPISAQRRGVGESLG